MFGTAKLKDKNTGPNTPKINIDEGRFIVMPQKISVTPEAINIPVEGQNNQSRSSSSFNPNSGISNNLKTSNVNNSQNIIPEVKAEHRLELIFVVALVVASIVAGVLVWWYRMNPVAAPIPTPTTPIQTGPQDLGFATTASDVSGRVLGSVRVRIPASSQTGQAVTYQVTAGNQSQAVGGVFNFSPAGQNFNGPISIVLSYFDTDVQIAKINERDLKATQNLPNGMSQIFGVSTVDVNANEVTVIANSFPLGPLYLSAQSSGPSSGTVQPFKDFVLKDLSASVLTSTADIDQDGLTDLEEEIYGSNVSEADTDKDEYPDGLEVRNKYSPIEPKPKKIIETDKTKLFNFTRPDYSIIYPAKFVADGILDNGIYSTLFTPSDTGEFIQFINTDAKGQNLADWYKSLGADPDKFVADTYRGQPALRSPNGSTIYWLEGGRVWGWIYHTGTSTAVNYLSTWTMMQNSLTLGANLTEIPVTTPSVSVPETVPSENSSNDNSSNDNSSNDNSSNDNSSNDNSSNENSPVNSPSTEVMVNQEDISS